jgi:serine/threonine protein kinase
MASTVKHTTGQLPSQHLLKQRYLIIQQVGMGGMGAVYRVADKLFGGTQRALKELSQNHLQPHEIQDAVEAFKREAMILATLDHPDLPHIHDCFDEDGRSYLVMDFIEGETLEERLKKTPGDHLTIPEALTIGKTLCDALGYLHTRPQPIIFRDLKPSNIMLTPNGTLFLIDFGIARIFNPGRPDTQALGTQGYASPEQYTRTATPLSDIYSLGAVLHHMLSGNDPTTNSPTVFDFPSLPGVPQEVNDFVHKLVAKDPTYRPASMAVVKQTLDHLLVPPPPPTRILPTPPSPTQGALLYTYKQHTGPVMAVAWSPDGRLIASASDDETIQLWESHNGKSLATYLSGIVRALAWARDSRYLAIGSKDKTVQIWDTRAGKLFVAYTPHKLWVRAVAWSPDGRYLASSSDDNTIQVWDVTKGKPLMTYRGHSDSVCALAWSPDSARIASASDDNTVHVWQAASGTLITSYRQHKDYVRAVAWSSDGKKITSGSWDHTVHIWDASTGNRVWTCREHTKLVHNVTWQPGGSQIASAGKDKTVFLWNASNGDCLFAYHQHRGSVNALAWSPDGTRLASAGDDQTVQIWQAC